LIMVLFEPLREYLEFSKTRENTDKVNKVEMISHANHNVDNAPF
jgi:hypothetical protein